MGKEIQMALTYVLREGIADQFKIGHTKGELSKTIAQLSRGNPRPLTEYETIVSDEEIACETYLHRKLRSRKVVEGGGREFFELPTSELDEAIADARSFLEDFVSTKKKADELCGLPDNGSVVPATPEDCEIHKNICLVREEQDEICIRREFLECKIKLRMGQAAALGNLATWKAQSTNRFDQTTFQREHPSLFAAFQRTTTSRIFRLK
jgi:hypothetical protein